jgi:GNAT superfamily N-acetyltransferase
VRPLDAEHRRALRGALVERYPWITDPDVGPRAVEAGECDRCGAESRLVTTCGPTQWAGLGRRCAAAVGLRSWCDGHADDATRWLAHLRTLPDEADTVARLWWVATGEVRMDATTAAPLLARALPTASPPVGRRPEQAGHAWHAATMVQIDRVDGDHWARTRDIRMRALRDAPDAYWATADDEAAVSPGQWRARLDRTDAVTFLAVVDGTDAGLAVGAPHHNIPGDAGLYAVWVAPDMRGRGVGDALVSAVVEWARAAGHRRLRVEVADDNAHAVRLYERGGLVTTGVHGRLPPPRDHVTEHERAVVLRS